MLIDLSEVLSEPHKSIDEVVGTEMKEVKVSGSRFPVSRTQPVHIHVEYAGEKKLHISCDGESDEANYIDGYHLDVEQLLYNEILVGWPMKVLCSEDCKGICSVCGQNLNEGSCDCEDTSLDPRMSVIRDLYKNFKEV